MCKIWREGLVVCPTTLSDMIGSTVYPSLVHAREISLCFLGHVSECFGRATGPSLGCFPGSLGSRLSCLRCPFPLAATLLLAAFACLLVLGMAFLLGRLLRCLAGWFLYPGPRWCSPCRFVLSARVCCCRRGWRKRHHVRCEPPAFQPRRKQRTYMTLNTQLAVRKPALNQSLRGGGSPSEADLLTSLQTLLQSFAGDNKQTGSHKGSPKGSPPKHVHAKGKGLKGSFSNSGDKGSKGFSKGSAKGKGKGNIQQAPPNSEGALLVALTKLVERCSKQGADGLLNRLGNLVQVASQGKLKHPKNKQPKPRLTHPLPASEKGNDKPPRQFPTFADIVSKGSPNTANPHVWTEVTRKKNHNRLTGVKAENDPSVSILPSVFAPGNLSSEKTLLQSLEKGQGGKAQFCLVRSLESAVHLQNLASVHELKDSVGLLVQTKQADSVDKDTKSVLLPVQAKDKGPLLTKFWVLPLATDLPPLPKFTLSSTSPKVNRELACFRVAVCKSFLDDTQWEETVKAPIQTVKSLLPASAFHSSFKWTKTTQTLKDGGQETVLEGFLKVDKASADEVAKLSGSKGVFLSRLRQEEPKPCHVTWVEKLEDEKAWQYYARVCQKAASSSGCPVAYRKGGGNSLGLRGTGVGPAQTGSWFLQGVPRNWTANDVESVLSNAGCSETSVLRPPRRKCPWLVRTKPPNQFDSCTQVVGIEHVDTMLMLVKAPSRSRSGASIPIAGGKWGHASSTSPIPAVAPPLPQEEKVEGTEQIKKKVKTDVVSNHPDFTTIECGGGGDCGYLSLCVAMGMASGLSLQEAQSSAAVAAKTLRCDVQDHIRKNSGMYSPFWCPDTDADENTEGGVVPTTFDAWVDSLTRKGQWISGLVLKAISRRCGVQIVVIELVDNEFREPVIFGKPKREASPIVLLLHDRHYQLFALKPNRSIPNEWLKGRESNSECPLLRGAGSQSAAASPRKAIRFWASETPSVKSSGGSKRLWDDATPSRSLSKSSSLVCQTPSYAATSTKKGRVDHSRVLSLGELVPQTGSRTWWKCNLCDFSIPSGSKGDSQRSWSRRKHLQTAHGITASKIPKLPNQGTCPNAWKAKCTQEKLEQRWNIVWELYQKKRWPGSHDIPRERIPTKFKGVFRTQCKRCHVKLRTNELFSKVCAKSISKQILEPLSARKAVWQSIYGEASDILRLDWLERNFVRKRDVSKPRKIVHKQGRVRSSFKVDLSKKADGLAATRRGKRAERVGEARHPGPCSDSLSSLKCWSVNCRSWKRHGNDLLLTAAISGVKILMIQEHGLTTAELGVTMRDVQKAGWQMLPLPANSLANGGRGGIAILVREPLAALKISDVTLESGQILRAEIFGLGHPLRVVCLYQRKAGQEEFLNFFQQNAVFFNRGCWIVGGDFNENVQHGTVANFLRQHGGDLISKGRYIQNTKVSWEHVPAEDVNVRFIDGIFFNGPCFKLPLVQELPPVGADHTIPEATFFVDLSPGEKEFRMARHRKRCEMQEGVTRPDIQTSFCSCEIWNRVLLEDVNSAWHQWCLDAESCLIRLGILEPSAAEVALVQYSFREGGARMAPSQRHRERELRRILRRLQEAQLKKGRGQTVPNSLRRKLNSLPGTVGQLARQNAWGPAIQRVQQDLQTFLCNEQTRKSQKWKQDMSHWPSAIKWIQNTAAPAPWLLRGNGQTTTCRASGAKLLSQVWAPIFGVGHDDQTAWQNFQRAYGPFLEPPHGNELPELQPISASSLQRVANKMKRSSAGVDGWDATLLSHLPPEGWDRLAQLLNRCEEKSEWLTSLKVWKLVFIPKGKSDSAQTATDALQVRPIAVGSLIYRLWGKVRLQQLAPHLTNHLAPFQSGGNAGPDVESMLVSLALDFPSDTYQYAMALDFSKAFDSTDAFTALEILKLWKIPSAIVGLLAAQWFGHSRISSFGGAVFPHEMTGTCGLPQGDPWSPLSMAAVLAAPLRKLQQEHPGVGQMLYLDDRTILGRSVADIRAVQSAWNELSDVTRLQTHPQKTQLWGRTQEAKRYLQSSNEADVKDCGEVLGAVDGLGSNHPKEEARRETTRQRARHIMSLPISQRTKQLLANALLTPQAVWGIFNTGRPCTQEQLLEFTKCFRESVRGSKNRGDRSSRPLQRVFLLGHTCDLALVACSRFMNALNRWTLLRIKQGWFVPSPRAPIPPVMQYVSSFLTEWGWHLEDWGRWSGPSGSFDARNSKQVNLKAMHDLRTDWRLTQMKTWQDSNRIDAICARRNNLHLTAVLLDKLRKVAKKTSIDGIAVMCGGVWSQAVDRFGDRQIRPTCPYCSSEVVPELEHIYWFCNAFDVSRNMSPPRKSAS